MADFWRRLRDRKLVQWALAYAAGAFALLQGVDIVAGKFGWPGAIERALIVVLCIGFFVALVLAWYHGERGAQRVSGMEVSILALLLALGGGALWRVASTSAPPGAPPVAKVDASQSAAANSSPPSAAATGGADAIPPKSIAVLPFENLSEDKSNKYFADGLQDLILTKLADIGDLTVVSRTSTAKYASRPDDLKTIARQLGVAHIVEGSVQKAGNEVLINVQLIDARGDRHLWADNYQRTLDNIFGVEGEVAQKIADALKAKLTPAQAQAVADVPTRNPQAYDAYLRARHHADAVSRGDTAQAPLAIAAFEEAISEDAGFALAWADLASFRLGLRYVGTDRSVENLRKAEAEALRALALGPQLADAHLAMAGVQRFVHHDFMAARDEARRAIELRPNFADAYVVLGINEWHLGHYAADLEALERASALNPRDADNAYSFGVSQTSVRDYAGARRSFERVLEIDPQRASAYSSLAELEILQHGDIEAAAKVLRSMAPGTPESFGIAGLRVQLALYARDFATARKLAGQLAERHPERLVDIAMLRGEVEWLAGDHPAAAPFHRIAIDLLQGPSADVGVNEQKDLALAWARLGDTARAKAEYDKARALFGQSTGLSADAFPLDAGIVEMHLALGENAAAIDALRAALAQPANGFRISVAQMRIDPAWDPLRSDPRFDALVRASQSPAATTTVRE